MRLGFRGLEGIVIFIFFLGAVGLGLRSVGEAYLLWGVGVRDAFF